MAASVMSSSSTHTDENSVILRDIPALLKSRMTSCVSESAEYQQTHDEYMEACAKLKRKIAELQHDRLALASIESFQSYQKSLHDTLHKTTVLFKQYTTLRLHQHAAQISLAVRRKNRQNIFSQLQEHIAALQDLREKHDISLNQLRDRLQGNQLHV